MLTTNSQEQDKKTKKSFWKELGRIEKLGHRRTVFASSCWSDGKWSR